VSPDVWLSEVSRWRPHAIMGYVNVLRLFGESVLQAGGAGISPRLVFTTSELLDEGSRSFLGSVFKAPVFNIYASAEAGCMAWECPRCGAMHISSDTVVFEVLKDGHPVGAGEEGEVVVTNLHSYTMPFIRYRQGDLARMSARQPACGRNLPLLDAIEGRQDDCIVLPEGRRISYSPFYYCVQSTPGLRRWRIVQEDLHTLRVELEPGPGFDPAARAVIAANLRNVVGLDMAITVDVVASLTPEPGRKFRSVSSRVGRP
jgi:phenylacetate-CoA ligase